MTNIRWISEKIVIAIIAKTYLSSYIPNKIEIK